MPRAISLGIGTAAGGGGAFTPARLDPVLWLDTATQLASDTQAWRNLGTGGADLDAQAGSAGRAELRGVAGLVLTGLSGNYASTPDAAALDITNDLDVRVRVAMSDWTPSSNQTFIGKYSATSQISWYLWANTNGTLRFGVAADGVNDFSVNSTVATGVSDGDAAWVRVTFESGSVKFFTAPDSATVPSSWTQLGSTLTMGGSVTSIFNSTSALQIGVDLPASNRWLAGRMFRTQVRSGIGGTVAFDADFTVPAAYSTSFTATTGQTVTINATSGADSNDPLYLDWTGTNYLYLPGVSGNYASAPPNAAYDSEDADIAFCVAYDTVPVGALPLYVGVADSASAGQYRAIVAVLTDGTLRYYWHDGTTARSATSTQAASLVAGEFLWLRATMDYNAGGTYEVKFYVSTDVTSGTPSWTQLGSAVTGAQLANAPVSGKGIGVGLTGQAGTPAKVRRVILRSGIDGSVVFDANFATGITSGGQTTFTESSSNAATVTINRSTTGRKAVAVTRPVWLLGTDDYFEIADNALLDFGASDSFTVMAVARRWGTTTGALIGKKVALADNSAGYAIYNDSNWATRYADGSAEGVTFSPVVSGSLVAVAAVRNVSADTVTLYLNLTPGTGGSTNDPTTGSLANSEAFRIGRLSGIGTTYIDAEVYAVLLFRRALTVAEIGQLVTYYGAA